MELELSPTQLHLQCCLNICVSLVRLELLKQVLCSDSAQEELEASLKGERKPLKARHQIVLNQSKWCKNGCISVKNWKEIVGIVDVRA